MSMTHQKAKQLGRLIANARAKKGVALRALAGDTGISAAWLSELEAGKYLDPSPNRLVRLAAVLEIPPRRIDTLVQGAMSTGLPEPRVYFRTKMALTPEESERVMSYIEHMRGSA